MKNKYSVEKEREILKYIRKSLEGRERIMTKVIIRVDEIADYKGNKVFYILYNDEEQYKNESYALLYKVQSTPDGKHLSINKIDEGYIRVYPLS